MLNIHNNHDTVIYILNSQIFAANTDGSDCNLASDLCERIDFDIGLYTNHSKSSLKELKAY